MALIVFEVVVRGIGAINWGFFTSTRRTSRRPGGLANAIVGTLVITALATVIGVPIGMLAGDLPGGVRAATAGSRRRRPLRANVLMGMPSIIVGVFVVHVPGGAGRALLAAMPARWRWRS